MEQVVVNPTTELYYQIQAIAEQFNKELFGHALPPTMFTLQRGKNTTGYFSPARWRHAAGKEVGEIALNPSYFADQPIIQLFQTIVHEQCHLWQHEFGSPTRMGYHNTEWAEKMVEVGLMPSSTGEVGGRKTGQKMADYPIEGGKFLSTCADMMDGEFFLTWVDRGLNVESICHRAVARKFELYSVSERKLYVPVKEFFPGFKMQICNESVLQKRKVKYCCPTCEVNVWGKGGLLINCGTCNALFEELT